MRSDTTTMAGAPRRARHIYSLGLALLASALILSACDTTGNAAAGDESAAFANLAAEVQSSSLASGESTIVDESTSASETTSTSPVAMMVGSGNLNADANRAITATVTVTHSYPNWAGSNTTTMASDVVTVVRSWTDARGNDIVDTVVRPEIPVAAAYLASGGYDPNSFVYTPSPANPDLGLSWNNTSQQWTLKATETKTIDGVLVASTKLTQVWDGTNRPHLVQLTKAGEAIGMNTGDVKLSTTIWYNWTWNPATSTGKNNEFLRSLDYLNSSNTLVKREIYAWGLSTLAGLPTKPSSLALNVTPAAPASFDLVYQTDPTVAVASYVPVAGNLSSFPALDVSKWLRLVLQAAGPRIADWYKPIVQTDGSYVGNYVRRFTLTSTATGVKRDVYSLSDGTTVVHSGSATKFRAAGNGSVTTTWAFSDGTSASVTITPTATGYTMTRSLRSGGSQTYTVAYTKDTAGEVVAIAVTDQSSGATNTFTLVGGVWTKN